MSIPLDVVLGHGWETGATRWVDDPEEAMLAAEIAEDAPRSGDTSRTPDVPGLPMPELLLALTPGCCPL